MLAKLNITDRKVTIDLDSETIELEDEYSIDDILESAGILTPERAKELQDEVSRMRELFFRYLGVRGLQRIKFRI